MSTLGVTHSFKPISCTYPLADVCVQVQVPVPGQRCKCIMRTAGTVSKNNNSSNSNNERETISSPVIYVLLWFSYACALIFISHARGQEVIGDRNRRSVLHAKSTIDMC